MSAEEMRAQVGDTPVLSDREMEIIRLVATGATNQQIARALSISPNTVKVHLRNVFEKLGVESRTEATMVAVRQGWVVVQEGVAAPTSEVGQPAPLQAALPVELPPPPEMPTLNPALTPAQQRLVLLVAALLALFMGFLPTVARISGAGQNSAPSLPRVLSDRSLPVSNPSTLAPSTRWQVRAPLPSARDRLAVAAVEGKIYAIGGENTQGALADTQVYDPATNGWLPRADKPTPVNNATAVVLDGKIYLPGGSLADGRVTTIMEVYDPEADNWRQVAALPAPRAAYAVAAADNTLFLFGGWDGEQATDTAWRYEASADRWTSLAALPARTTLAAAAPLPGRGQAGAQILLAGGEDGAHALAQVWLYDVAANAWSKRAALGAPRAGLSLVTLGSAIYALGGQGEEAQPFSERYEPATDTWSRLDAPFIGAWRNLAAAVISQRVYAVGGWGGQYLATTLELQPMFRQVLPAAGKNS